MDPQARIHQIEESLKSQEATVKRLNDHSKALHDELKAKNRTYDEISETVDKDAKCIDRLQTDESSCVSHCRIDSSGSSAMYSSRAYPLPCLTGFMLEAC